MASAAGCGGAGNVYFTDSSIHYQRRDSMHFVCSERSLTATSNFPMGVEQMLVEK